MKKNLNKLLLISLISFFVISILLFLSVRFYNFNLMSITKMFAEEVGPAGVVFFPLGILIDFALAIYLAILCLIIPCGVLLLKLVLMVIARLFQIGNQKKWKNIVSKVFIYISLVLMIFLGIYILLLFINTLNLFLLLSIVGKVVEIILVMKEIKKIRNLY